MHIFKLEITSHKNTILMKLKSIKVPFMKQNIIYRINT